jgi:hypothetical protein
MHGYRLAVLVSWAAMRMAVPFFTTKHTKTIKKKNVVLVSLAGRSGGGGQNPQHKT